MKRKPKHLKEDLLTTDLSTISDVVDTYRPVLAGKSVKAGQFLKSKLSTTRNSAEFANDSLLS